jgi:hypothetical protein
MAEPSRIALVFILVLFGHCFGDILHDCDINNVNQKRSFRCCFTETELVDTYNCIYDNFKCKTTAHTYWQQADKKDCDELVLIKNKTDSKCTFNYLNSKDLSNWECFSNAFKEPILKIIWTSAPPVSDEVLVISEDTYEFTVHITDAYPLPVSYISAHPNAESIKPVSRDIQVNQGSFDITEKYELATPEVGSNSQKFYSLVIEQPGFKTKTIAEIRIARGTSGSHRYTPNIVIVFVLLSSLILIL